MTDHADSGACGRPFFSVVVACCDVEPYLREWLADAFFRFAYNPLVVLRDRPKR